MPPNFTWLCLWPHWFLMVPFTFRTSCRLTWLLIFDFWFLLHKCKFETCIIIGQKKKKKKKKNSWLNEFYKFSIVRLNTSNLFQNAMLRNTWESNFFDKSKLCLMVSMFSEKLWYLFYIISPYLWQCMLIWDILHGTHFVILRCWG